MVLHWKRFKKKLSAACNGKRKGCSLDWKAKSNYPDPVMERNEITRILELFSRGEISRDEVIEKIASDGIENLGFAAIDTSRERRTGIPEVIYCPGKTPVQVAEIAVRMEEREIAILATRATLETYEAVREKIPAAVYRPEARIILHQKQEPEWKEGYVAIVSAGTSDIPVAEEAAITSEFLGNRVQRIYDVGVAGIHRLFQRMELIRGATVIIVVAGMEGALASVVGGLVDKPVIGIPSSTGYGTNFGGVSAMLSMLNSCASGVSVVNIDNGFGAACQANLIMRLATNK
jgi:pyridinium-3,5-biscarboxylic acid mononucleotide synthase